MDNFNNNRMHENGNESTLGLTSKMISLEQIQMTLPAVCLNFINGN